MRRGAAPARGDVMWLSFSPRAGRGQAGRRPALVLTLARFDDRVGLAFVCPVTSRVKGYPFEVSVRDLGEVSGVVLVDQLRSLDWRARRAEPAGKAPAAVMAEVLAKAARAARRVTATHTLCIACGARCERDGAGASSGLRGGAAVRRLDGNGSGRRT